MGAVVLPGVRVVATWLLVVFLPVGFFFFRDRIPSEAENWQAEHEAMVVGLMWGADRHNFHVSPPCLRHTQTATY
jgi:hypothetical protein